jgi:23S rRNA pseudouridine1911/1915/1917 synthase
MAKASADLEILFEDDAVIGIAKPAGLPTANAARGAASLVTRLRERRPAPPFLGIVSRLDAPVSGVVVVAKTPAAAAGLASQFRDRSVRKTYVAVVEGRFPAPLNTWVEWHDLIGRRGQERLSTVLPSAAPRAASTVDDDIIAGHSGDDAGDDQPRPAHVRARVVRRAGEVSLVELEPTTGRRHQLRVQLASRGCPIVGDRLYGARLPFPAGIALHASTLDFTHPVAGRPMRLQAVLPDSWKDKFSAVLPGR